LSPGRSYDEKARSLPDEGRNETEKERLDRNLDELFQGLRVALPGVQVLFAFLLVLPFQQRFAEVTGFQKGVYFVTLLCTAAASLCFVAPTARHRVQFRRDDKAYVVFSSNQLAIAGLAFLGAAIVGAVVLVTDFLFEGWAAFACGATVATVIGWVWFGSPLNRRLNR
jgi:Family of unknown function (DUF6328)